MDIYEELAKGTGDLKTADEETSGMDSFLSGNKLKVASIDQLADFFRISSDTLVHKAKKDLWRISEDEKGQTVIERLFDPNTKEAIKV
jgi:hypothetical protein